MQDVNFSKELFKTKTKEIKKGEIILRNGDPSDYFFYVEKGCLRSYTIERVKNTFFNLHPKIGS
ncbi:MAG: cyclic nucleotide-binding domain-containing protein [Bacteroidia bacterium]|nr:cyclic nucleotide-binding domain-containing protein [Bacteroidia bacterium]